MRFGPFRFEPGLLGVYAACPVAAEPVPYKPVPHESFPYESVPSKSVPYKSVPYKFTESEREASQLRVGILKTPLRRVACGIAGFCFHLHLAARGLRGFFGPSPSSALASPPFVSPSGTLECMQRGVILRRVLASPRPVH